MTATIMPSVAADIGGYAWFGWAVAIYLVGAIAAGATAGRLSLAVGLRRAMAVGGLVYAAGCAASALAPHIGLFLAGRLLQGVGGGWVVGLSYVAVTRLFEQRLWSLVLSAVAGVWGAATLISPLIGGLFAQAGFWQGAFWLFAAQGLGFVAAALALVRPGAEPGEAAPVRAVLGSLGALSAAIFAIAGAGLASGVATSAALAAAGVVLLGLFLKLNAGAAAPLLPRSAGDPRTGSGAGLAAIFALTAATASFTVYGPALMQALFGASPVLAGYVLGCEALAWTAAALIVAGRAGDGGWIRLGAAMITLAVVALAVVMPRGPLPLIGACAAVQGTGFGLAWAFASGRIVANAPPEEQALASSAVPTTQMIGTAAGAAAAGVIANLLGFGQGVTHPRALEAALWLFAAFAPLAMLGLLAAWRLGAERFRPA
jgi:MFS family permease